MARTSRYARCGEPKRSCTLSKTAATAKVKETRKPESRMMRQVSCPVRRGAGRKGRKDLARSLPNFQAIGLRLLLWISHVSGPSMTAYARHNYRHFGVRQQYPPISATNGRPLPQGRFAYRTTHGKNLCPLDSFAACFSTPRALLPCKGDA